MVNPFPLENSYQSTTGSTTPRPRRTEFGPMKVSVYLADGTEAEYTPDSFYMEVQGRNGEIKKRKLEPGDTIPIWVKKGAGYETVEVTYLGVASSSKKDSSLLPMVKTKDDQMYLLRRTTGPSAIERGLYFLGM